jgi:hypothetical protein
MAPYRKLRAEGVRQCTKCQRTRPASDFRAEMGRMLKQCRQCRGKEVARRERQRGLTVDERAVRRERERQARADARQRRRERLAEIEHQAEIAAARYRPAPMTPAGLWCCGGWELDEHGRQLHDRACPASQPRRRLRQPAPLPREPAGID